MGAGVDFETAPPRRAITDVTEILNTEIREDRPEAKIHVLLAGSQPPLTSDRATLARFFHDRGLAARKLGRMRQAIEDLTKASELSEALPPNVQSQILIQLSGAENASGRRIDAVRHKSLAIELDTGRLFRRIKNTASLSIWVRNSGDLVRAEELVRRAEQDMGARQFRGRRAWLQMLVDHAKARLLEAKGRSAEAESLYRRHVSVPGELNPLKIPNGAESDYESVQAHYGRNLLFQGRFVEAEVLIRAALRSALKRTGRYGPFVARATADLSRVMNNIGRYQDGESLARVAIEIHEVMGSAKTGGFLVYARRRLAHALAAQDRWSEVLDQYETIRAAFAVVGESKLRASYDYALALLMNDRITNALIVSRRALNRTQTRMGDQHYVTALSRGVYAMTLAALHDDESALDEFRLAVPILIDQSRRYLGDDGNRAAQVKRVEPIIESYIRLLGKISGSRIEKSRRISAAAEAFRVAEFVRGQAVQRAVIASAVRASTKDPELARFIRREQNVQKHINVLNELFVDAVSVPTKQQDAKAVVNLRARINELTVSHGALMKKIESDFPDYASLMIPNPATIEEVRATLKLGEAMIATYVGRNQSYVWAVSNSSDFEFAVVPIGKKMMEGMVRDLRRAFAPKTETLSGIPEFDTRLSHALYRLLLDPVSQGWQAANSLLVVAHGALGQLPFSVLVTEGSDLGAERRPLFSNYRKIPWLARTHAVTVVPSVSSLVALRRLPALSAEQPIFAGFGDPWFNQQQAADATVKSTSAETPLLTSRGGGQLGELAVSIRAAPNADRISIPNLADLPRLPDTADEVRSIAAALKADEALDVFTGARASESRVKSMDLSNRRIIVFATHGLVPGDIDGLTQPALALSSPAVTGGREDGLLTMGEILGLRLNADWVVLSACNTAAGEGKGAEAVSGLGRAFFYAGTRALLVSNWPVETSSARKLTTDLFHRQARDVALTRAQALRQSMLVLIDGQGFVDARGRTIFSYAHPIFWAPFSLIGDGGGNTAGS